MVCPFHLNKEKIINFGAFYTSFDYIDMVWNFINPYIDENTIIFDPSCGYGNFLTRKTVARKIGNDIDSEALKIAKTRAGDVVYYNYNFLKFFDRKTYNINNKEKLIVIGNPPYNDITSQAKKRTKKLEFEIDTRIRTRDVGISFLRAFDYLNANYVCVLHPLSYLIKRANFKLLKNFSENYVLLDGVIISSKHFMFTSKISEFPIIIALYKRQIGGMDYEYIQDFPFKTIEGKTFKINEFEFIGNFVEKYPKKNININKDDILFYTLRDINALKRNKTFMNKKTSNVIKVDVSKLDYYIYIDVFKEFINCVPYYFGNFDIIINRDLFKKYRKYFISRALKKWIFLKKYYPNASIYRNDTKFILEYFKELLGEHFVIDSKNV